MSELSDFSARVNSWLNREYDEAVIADWARVCISDLNRRLRVRDMIVTFSAPLADSIDLPDNWRELNFVRRHNGAPMKYISNDEMFSNRRVDMSANVYTIIGSTLHLDSRLSTISGNADISYFADIPEISNDIGIVGWLTTRYWDVILFGTLMAGTAFGVDDARIPMWMQAYNSAVDGANFEYKVSNVSGSTLRGPVRKGFG